MIDAGKTEQRTDVFDAMDRMYRLQRYFYDATRKFYLLGRDRLIKEIDPQPNESILEVGCGTARNLLILARSNPATHFYGLDASAAMLETAETNLARSGSRNVMLVTALADDFAFDRTFGLGARFDKIFFSYSISMIPPWKESVDNAIANLRPGGSLYFVDFYDQRGLPAWFRRMLQRWLKLFHVRYRNGLIPHLRELESNGLGTLEFEPLFRGYSFIATFRKN